MSIFPLFKASYLFRHLILECGSSIYVLISKVVKMFVCERISDNFLEYNELNLHLSAGLTVVQAIEFLLQLLVVVWLFQFLAVSVRELRCAF